MKAVRLCGSISSFCLGCWVGGWVNGPGHVTTVRTAVPHNPTKQKHQIPPPHPKPTNKQKTQRTTSMTGTICAEKKAMGAISQRYVSAPSCHVVFWVGV